MIYNNIVDKLYLRYEHSAKFYQIRWRRLRQKSRETAWELAVSINMVYRKAFPDRDGETRREQLLAKFIDALTDGTATFNVKFHKQPREIYQAA